MLHHEWMIATRGKLTLAAGAYLFTRIAKTVIAHEASEQFTIYRINLFTLALTAIILAR
jgi:hypothetical protein